MLRIDQIRRFEKLAVYEHYKSVLILFKKKNEETLTLRRFQNIFQTEYDKGLEILTFTICYLDKI